MSESPETASPRSENPTDSIVLEEEIDPNYVPTDTEVEEYAKWLGMHLEQDSSLLWIAREGLMAPLPKNWKPCKTKDTEDIYYFNFDTGESTWDHPCDGYYKKVYEEEKKKQEIKMKQANDKQRSKAKQDVEQLLGVTDTKKKKKRADDLGGPVIAGKKPAPMPVLSMKPIKGAPLPDIKRQLSLDEDDDRPATVSKVNNSEVMRFDDFDDEDSDLGERETRGRSTIPRDREPVHSVVMKFTDREEEAKTLEGYREMNMRMGRSPSRRKGVKSSKSSKSSQSNSEEDELIPAETEDVMMTKLRRSVDAYDSEGGSSSIRLSAESEQSLKALHDSRPKRKEEDQHQREVRINREEHLKLMAELRHEWDEEVRLHQTSIRKQRTEMMKDIEKLEVEYEEKVQTQKERLQKLQAEQEHLHARVGADENLATLLKQAEDEVEALSSRLRGLVDSNAALEAKLADSQKATEDATDTSSSLQAEVTRLSGLNRALTIEQNQWNQSSVELIAQSENLQAQLERLQEDSTKDKASLEDNIALLTTNLQAAEKKIALSASSEKSLSSQVEALQSKETSLQRELVSTVSKLDASTHKLTSLESSHEDVLSSMRADARRLALEKTSLEDQLAKAQETIEVLSKATTSPSAGEEQVNPLVSLLEHTKQSLSRTTSELDVERAKVLGLVEEVATLQKQLDRANKETVEARELLAVSMEELGAKHKASIDALEAEKTQLQHSVQSNDTALADMNDMVEILKDELQSKIECIRDAESRLKTQKEAHLAELTAKDKALDDLRAEKEALSLAARQESSDASVQMQQLSETMAAMNELRRERDGLRGEMEELEAMNRKLLDNTVALRDESARLREQYESAVAQQSTDTAVAVSEATSRLEAVHAADRSKLVDELQQKAQQLVEAETRIQVLISTPPPTQQLPPRDDSEALAPLKAEIASLMAAKASLEMEIAGQARSQQELRVTLEEVSGRKEALLEQVRLLQRKVDQAGFERANEQAELDSLVDVNKTLRERTELLVTDVETLRGQLRDAQSASRRAADEQDQVDALQRELLNDKSRVRSLEKELDTLKFESSREIASLQARLDAKPTLPSTLPVVVEGTVSTKPTVEVPESLLAMFRSQEEKLNELFSQRSGLEAAFRQQTDLVQALESKLDKIHHTAPFAAGTKAPLKTPEAAAPEIAESEEDADDDVDALASFVLKLKKTYAADPKEKKTSKLAGVKKLIKEKMLIDSAKEELDREAEVIREKHRRLHRAKEQWKEQSRLGVDSPYDKTSLKEKSQSINKKAAALNARIEAARRVRKWIDERKKKLADLEKVVMSSDAAAFASPEGELDKLTRELDDDLSVLDVSSAYSSSTPSYSSSDRAPRLRPSSHRKYKSTNAYPPDTRGRYYAQPPPYPSHAQFYQDPPPQGYYQMRPPPPPAMYFNDEISDSLSQFNRGIHGPARHPHWTAPLLPSAPTRDEGPVLMHPQDTRKPPSLHETKRQLQEITNRMASSKEAYEDHANWLDKMRKEISTFDHKVKTSSVHFEIP